jgi:hypothetical protein
MQMVPGSVKTGTLTTCLRIVRGEGVSALYHGVSQLNIYITGNKNTHV